MTLISALTPVVTPALADEYEIEQAGASFKITGTQIMTLLAANISLDAARITSGTLAVARGGTNIGSYAVGDLLYASAAGVLSKLADVATGNALISGGVATAPAWGKIDLAAHITGILPSANGGTGVNNAGTLTNASNTTITGGGTLALGGFTGTLPATGTFALLAVANIFTAAQTAERDAIGVVSTDGLILTNATAAAAGAQQKSPRLRLTGQGWKTNATAASQTVDFALDVLPVQGAANPTANLNIGYQVNAGGYSTVLQITQGGNLINALISPFSSASNVAYGVGDLGRGVWSNGGGHIGIATNQTDRFGVNAAGVTVGSSEYFGFTSISAPGTSAADTALGRNAAGAVEINNGTAGQWGSLLAGVRDANLSSAIDTLTIGHQISAGTVATNCGIGMIFNVATDNAGTPIQDVNAARIVVSWATAANATRKARMTLNVYDQTNVREWLRGETNGAAMIGFLGANAAIRQTSGGNLTNNVTSGGTTDQIDNFTDLTIYANDSAAIRNDIYQLARKLKQVNDSLRTYGLLT